MKRFALFMTMGVMSIWLSLGEPARAMVVTQLDLTGGAANYGGRFDHKLDRLLGQEGTILVGQYQPLPHIVPPITKGQKTFSLFTSGLNGAAAPSVVIDGFSITVDLSSLFFGVMRGDSLRAWNIGGLATGLFNPDTKEFFLSWDRLFDGGKGEGQATFFLRGVVLADLQPIPIPAGLVLYATGLFGLGSWTWWRCRANLPVAV